MTVVAVVCAAVLVVAAALALVRAERGPSMLDRTVALDILVTVLVAGTAVFAVVERRTDVVPVLVALSLVGFIGSVTIARFAYLEPEGEGRVRTKEEIAAEALERERQEALEHGRGSSEGAATTEEDRSSAERRPSAGADEHGGRAAEEHGGGAEGEVR